MEQLKRLLANISPGRRILILAAALGVAGALVAFTRWRTERDFRPLYTNLAAEDASAVLTRLRESVTEYRLDASGTTILVPSARVAELRLQMAGAGLPRTGRAGFELFDKTNFGVTDFAERINYRRALEGELERSIMSLAEVELARVHLTFPKDSVFVESREPAKASVMVKLRLGAKLSPANVNAVCHLVASAVEGLVPEGVSVLDMSGNLLSRPRRPASDNEPSEAALEYRHQMEKDLVAKINTTLDPLLGPEKYRAGISVECDFSGGEQSEETFDPAKSVMTTSQKTEDLAGVPLSTGVPGTASNLPRPTSRPGSGGSGTTRRTENISYQSSRIVRRTKLPQGTLRRMSVAILLDQAVRWEGVGAKARKIIEPPPAERIKIIRDLAAAATGLSVERGDQIIVETLPFEATLLAAPPPGPVPTAPAAPTPLVPLIEQMVRERPLAVAGAAAALLLLFILIVVILITRRRRKRARAAVSVQAEVSAHKSPAEIEAAGAAVLEQAGQELETKLAEQEALKRKMEAEALSALKLPAITSKKGEVLARHLVESSKKDPVTVAQILRTWIADRDR
jgi:flagellar M-ring protein FliF